MKKLISITAAAAMLLGTTSAFASPESDFEAAMKNPITGANVKMTMGMTIDKLGDGLKEDFPAELNNGSLISMDMALNASEDSKVLKSKIHMTMQDDEEFSQDSWLDMDLSDADNPVMTQITSMTDEEGNISYMVTDMASYISVNDYEDLLAQNKMMGVELNGKTPVYTDGKYTISLTDEDIYTILEDGFARFMPAASIGVIGEAAGPASIITTSPELPTPEASNDIIGGADDSTSMITFTPADISKLKLFGEDAITISIGLTEDKKYIHDMDMTIKINTNVYDLINTMGAIADIDEQEIQKELEGLTKENSDFACTITANMVYSDINTDIKIEFPELTEENTYKVTAPAFTKLDVPIDFREIDGEEVPFVQLRSLCSAVGITDDNITWDNGKVIIKYLDGDGTAVLTIGSTDVENTYNGEGGIINLDYAPYIKNDFTYVDVSFGDIIGEWIEVDYDTDNNAAVMLID